MDITSCCAGTIAALAFGAIVSTSAFAADVQTTPVRDWAAIQKARTAVQAQATRVTSLAKKLGATGATPGGAQPAEAFANVVRAYPPSCLNSPMALQLWATDPNFASNIFQMQITLPGDPLAADANEQNYTETDTVTLFRVPCSAGTSATLIEIDRPSGVDGNSTLYPSFPGISVAIGGGSVYYIRLADDPNTFFSTTYGLTPVVTSNVYALENTYSASAQQFDYNQAFTLYVDNFIPSDPNRITQFDMPTYNPAAYTEASQPLPISGYMSTNWSNPNQSGEGIVMQVYDDGDSATRILAFAWFTYDDNGLPFWLYGQASFAIGTRSVTAPTVYFQGGSFAPSFAVASVPHPAWGNVTFTFPDCAHMHISYSGNASAVQGPTGTSSATFQRVADVNGLVCQ
jgi:hypothetical protein